jgi:hypothetical protein
MIANASSARKLRFLLSDAMSFTREFIRDIKRFATHGPAAPRNGSGDIVTVPRN